jgi:hypothetical protein
VPPSRRGGGDYYAQHGTDRAVAVACGPCSGQWKHGKCSRYATLEERRQAWRASWDRMRAERAALRALHGEGDWRLRIEPHFRGD